MSEDNHFFKDAARLTLWQALGDIWDRTLIRPLARGGYEVVEQEARADRPTSYTYATQDAAILARRELVVRRALETQGWRDAEAGYWLDRVNVLRKDATLRLMPQELAEAAIAARKKADDDLEYSMFMAAG